MTIWLDVTTITGWRRPALGIVRVETEIARHFAGVEHQHVKFCRFNLSLESYFEVSPQELESTLKRLDAAVQSPPEPSSYFESSDISCTLPRGIAQPFNSGDTYISLGLDWDQKNMEFLYVLKQRLSLKVLLFCYDLIPIVLPQCCVPDVSAKFSAYFANVAWCADKIMCISECTRKDLLEFLENVGAPEPAIDVVRLGDKVLGRASQPPSPEVAEICNNRFILFVSTIEGRKNHEILYRAYKRLIKDGHRNMPLLVFVGMEGWGVESFMSTLHSDKQIKPFLRLLHHVADNDLILLYEKSEFTVYPSLYEGWGLPVAESLVHGKFCLASHAASIPEVGGDLIEYLDPNDEKAWADRLLWLFNNPEGLLTRQEKIARNFCHFSWVQTATSVLAAAEALSTDSAPGSLNVSTLS